MFRHQKIIFLITGIAMLGLLLLVGFGDNGWLELIHMRATHARLLRENHRLARQNQRMYRNIDRLQNDPEYIENIARRELGMIRQDELIFKFTSDSK